MTTITPQANVATPRTIEHFIDGAYVSGSSGRFGDVYDPTAGCVAARVELAGRDDVERAITSSAHAFVGRDARHFLGRACSRGIGNYSTPMPIGSRGPSRANTAR